MYHNIPKKTLAEYFINVSQTLQTNDIIIYMKIWYYRYWDDLKLILNKYLLLFKNVSN